VELSETLGLTHFLLATPAMLAEFKNILLVCLSALQVPKIKI
jgi:hypothetical protein